MRIRHILLTILITFSLTSSAQRFRNWYSAPRFVPVDTNSIDPTIGRVTVHPGDSTIYLGDGNKWKAVGGSSNTVINNFGDEIENYKTFHDSVKVANPSQPEDETVRDFINLNEGDILYFPERFDVYPPIDGSTITSNSVNIVGDPPMLIEDTPNDYLLAGGSVFSQISLNAKNVRIADIGVLMFADGDGIDITYDKVSGLGGVAEVSNVKIVYTSGVTHTQHGFLLQNYNRFYLDRVNTYNTFMGIVLKAQNGFVNECKVTKHSGIGFHIKSDQASGSSLNISVANTHTWNPSSTNADGFNILSFDATVENIDLYNCSAKNSYYGMKVISSGLTGLGLSNISVDGFKAENCILRGLYIEKDASNTNPVENLSFKNFQLINIRDKAVEIKELQDGVEFTNFYCTTSTSTTDSFKREFFDIGGTVKDISIFNIKLRNFFNDFDKDISIYFRGPQAESVGGLLNCNIRGGTPQSGISYHTNSDGTVLEPARNYQENRSFIVYNATGPVTINGIKNRFDDDYPTDLVPLGWELVILCKGNQTYTLQNNYGLKLLLPSDPIGGQVGSIQAKGQSIITFIKDVDVWLLKSVIEL